MVADGIQGYHTRHAYTRIRVRNSHTASSRREHKKGEGGWRGGGKGGGGLAFDALRTPGEIAHTSPLQCVSAGLYSCGNTDL